jgi:hypothetical protein
VPQKLLFNRLPPLTNLELYPLDERARFMAGGAQPDPGPDESLVRWILYFINRLWSKHHE